MSLIQRLNITAYSHQEYLHHLHHLPLPLDSLIFSFIKTADFFVVMFAFLFVDVFDTLGTLIGCASKANMLDEKGELKGN